MFDKNIIFKVFKSFSTSRDQQEYFKTNNIHIFLNSNRNYLKFNYNLRKILQSKKMTTQSFRNVNKYIRIRDNVCMRGRKVKDTNIIFICLAMNIEVSG